MLWVHYSSGESRYPTYIFTVSLQPLNFYQSKMSEHTKSGSASEIDVNEPGKNKNLKEIKGQQIRQSVQNQWDVSFLFAIEITLCMF